MSKFKFVLNQKGVRDLLFSEAMKSGMSEIAHNIVPDAENYEVKDEATRSIVTIKTDAAWFDNVENNTLLKSMLNIRRGIQYIKPKGNQKSHWRRVRKKK